MEKQRHCGFDPTRLVLLYTWTAQTPCYKEQEKQCAYSITFRHVLPTIVAVENNKNYTFQKCVFVALVIQHANRMLHIVMWSVRLYSISTLSHKRHDFL